MLEIYSLLRYEMFVYVSSAGFFSVHPFSAISDVKHFISRRGDSVSSMEQVLQTNEKVPHGVSEALCCVIIPVTPLIIAPLSLYSFNFLRTSISSPTCSHSLDISLHSCLGVVQQSTEHCPSTTWVNHIDIWYISTLLTFMSLSDSEGDFTYSCRYIFIHLSPHIIFWKTQSSELIS